MTLARDSTPAIRADYPEPLWIQAVMLIKSEIADGTLKPGMRLPPERELCLELRISRVTLRKALVRLVEEGVLNASHGRGWYVSAQPATAPPKEWPNSLESFSETASRMGLTATSTVLRAAASPATFDEAEELQIAPGTSLFHLDRVRFLGEVPIAVDTTAIPKRLVPGLAKIDFRTESLFVALSAAGVEPLRADVTIEAREADEETAALLGLETVAPLLVMRQLALDAADRPLFSSSISYAGDRYRLRTHFARTQRG